MKKLIYLLVLVMISIFVFVGCYKQVDAKFVNEDVSLLSAKKWFDDRFGKSIGLQFSENAFFELKWDSAIV